MTGKTVTVYRVKIRRAYCPVLPQQGKIGAQRACERECIETAVCLRNCLPIQCTAYILHAGKALYPRIITLPLGIRHRCDRRAFLLRLTNNADFIV